MTAGLQPLGPCNALSGLDTAPVVNGCNGGARGILIGGA